MAFGLARPCLAALFSNCDLVSLFFLPGPRISVPLHGVLPLITSANFYTRAILTVSVIPDYGRDLTSPSATRDYLPYNSLLASRELVTVAYLNVVLYLPSCLRTHSANT